jgi:multiple sugar transport system permease protein
MSGTTTATPRAVTPGPKPRRRKSVTNRSGTGLLLVLPALLFVLVFVIFPIAFAIYISLTNWPLIGTYHFIGLKNYEHITQDTAFTHAVVYTLVYTAAVTLPILVTGYAMAILVRSNRRGSTFFRTVFFLPYVIGLTTLSFLCLLELQPHTGAVNFVLSKLGITDGSTA